MSTTIQRRTEMTAPGERPAEEAEAILGRKLRLLRHARDLSLQSLAGMTGLSIGLLSQIERGLSSPSVKMLVALSKAFDVPLAFFFDEAVPVDEAERRLIVRREARPRIAMSHSGMSKELLTPDRERALEMFMITLDPGGTTGEQPYAYPGEVGGYVLSGRLRLWLDGMTFMLREGDAFSIPGDCPRRYANPDPFELARVIWTIAKPQA